MIRVEQISKQFGPVTAVNGISLEADKGEILGILGPNGAGKTTTLRIIAGYLKPSEGRVLINGVEMEEDPLRARKHIGYLPESAPLIPEMTVLDYLRYIAGLRGIRKKVFHDKITLLSGTCGIRDVMHRLTGTLSKGYRQRVGLAAVLLDDPEILILDEPTSGLDPNQTAELRELIREFGKTKTVLFSSHILSEAETVCSRIVILNNGKVIARVKGLSGNGSPVPGMRLILELDGKDGGETAAGLASLPGVLKVEPQEPSPRGERFLLETREDCRKEISLLIREKNRITLEMRCEQKKLEEIFMELTGASHAL